MTLDLMTLHLKGRGQLFGKKHKNHETVCRTNGEHVPAFLSCILQALAAAIL